MVEIAQGKTLDASECGFREPFLHAPSILSAPFYLHLFVLASGLYPKQGWYFLLTLKQQ